MRAGWAWTRRTYATPASAVVPLLHGASADLIATITLIVADELNVHAYRLRSLGVALGLRNGHDLVGSAMEEQDRRQCRTHEVDGAQFFKPAQTEETKST